MIILCTRLGLFGKSEDARNLMKRDGVVQTWKIGWCS
jgi:hypothetical protein